MELQIHDLVSSIRKEGIDAANEKAEQILSEAKEQMPLLQMLKLKQRHRSRLLRERLLLLEREQLKTQIRQRGMQ